MTHLGKVMNTGRGRNPLDDFGRVKGQIGLRDEVMVMMKVNRLRSVNGNQ